MPAYVPPHLRGKKASIEKQTRRGVRFIGNATGNVNVVSSKGKRYTPRHRSLEGKKKTLKAVKRITPNTAPVWDPSYAMRKAAPKFAKAVMDHLGLVAWQEPRKTKKAKRAKKVAKN